MGPTDPVNFRTFDGGHATPTFVHCPDRHRDFDRLPANYSIRGGGYSYSPASFQSGIVTLDMRAFNRLLRFDASRLEIEVEAGITLGELLRFLTPRGFWMPVIPGYPGITVGGCIAGDVHGKSHSLHGNFRHWVKSISLIQNDGSLRECSALESHSRFDLTLGGLGLTGVILKATLRIAPLAGGKVQTFRKAVPDIHTAYTELQEVALKSEFAYSWHRPWCRGDRKLGPGYVFHGATIPGSELPKSSDFDYRPLSPSANDRRLPISIFGGMGNRRTRWVYRAAKLIETSQGMMTESLFGSLFPFVAQRNYFQLFGRAGLQEVQVIIPSAAVDSFLNELPGLFQRFQPPAAVIALKLFKGDSSGIRFDGKGLGFAIDLARSAATNSFLEHLDGLCMEHLARPNILKDSRLSRRVFETTYPEVSEFKEQLRKISPNSGATSALAQRLGILE